MSNSNSLNGDRTVSRNEVAELPDGSTVAKPASVTDAVEGDNTVAAARNPDAHREQTTAQSRTPSVNLQAPGMPEVPGYAVLREVARGGMGAVYFAHDPAFDRSVAVKIMHAGQDSDRFVIESKVTAQLPHPGIPPVYTLGTLNDGRPFLAMKLIEGRTLSDELKHAQPHDFPRLLRVFEQICYTVGFAHSRNIIHRDLKPANVMVGAFGEVLVMDWGLARTIADTHDAAIGAVPTSVANSDTTQPGQVKGTPAYMAPEQARGERVDARADVFALGGILCAMLTGQSAFAGSGVLESIRKAANAELKDTFARLDSCGADTELIAITKKFLAAQADDRYANGEDAANAIAEYRESVEKRLQRAERERAAAEARAAEEVNTRRETEARIVEQRKRRRVQMQLLGALLSLLAGVLGFLWWNDKQHAAQQLRDQQAKSEQDRIEADARATAARLEGERDAEARNKAAQARDAIQRSTQLADELRKQFKFRESAQLLEQAAKLAERGAPELLPAVQQAQADLAFVVELDDIRYRKWLIVTDVNGEREVNTAMAKREYPKAFAARGLDIAKLAPKEFAAQIAKSPVKAELVAAIDDWSVYSDDDDLELKLMEIARLADPGQWTDRLRQPAFRKDASEMRFVANKIDPATAKPATLTLLATLLQRHLENPAPLLIRGRAIYPNDFELAFTLGMWYQFQTTLLFPNLGLQEIGHYEAARAIRPDNRSVLVNLANALFDKTDYNGALSIYTQLTAREPNNSDYHNAIARLYFEKKDYKASILASERAIALNPQDATLYGTLGQTYLATKDFQRANETFQKEIDLNPKSVSAHNNLGLTFLELNDWARAKSAFTTSVKLDPQYARGHYNLGLVYKHDGDYQQAKVCYQQAVKFNQNRVMYLNTLGWLLATGNDDIRDGKLAVAHAMKACQLTNWRDANALDTLAAACAEVGDFPAAIDYQQRIVNTFPTYMKSSPEARKRLELYLKKQPYRDPSWNRTVAPAPREK